MQYEIAGLLIDIACNNSYLINRMKSFSINSNKSPEINIRMKTCSSISIPEGNMIMDDVVKWYRKSGNEPGLIGYRSLDDNKILSTLDTDNSWMNSLISYVDNDEYQKNYVHHGEYFAFQLAGVLFRNYIIKKHGLIMHASSIEYNGKGIIFTAPSETGKSTHVKLW